MTSSPSLGRGLCVKEMISRKRSGHQQLKEIITMEGTITMEDIITKKRKESKV